MNADAIKIKLVLGRSLALGGSIFSKIFFLVLAQTVCFSGKKSLERVQSSHTRATDAIREYIFYTVKKKRAMPSVLHSLQYSRNCAIYSISLNDCGVAQVFVVSKGRRVCVYQGEFVFFGVITNCFIGFKRRNCIILSFLIVIFFGLKVDIV